MSQSRKVRRSRAELKRPSQHVLDIVDVLFDIMEAGDKAVSDAIAGSTAFQRLYRQCTALEARWSATSHSDPNQGVAQEDSDESMEGD